MRLEAFNREILEACGDLSPALLLSTGISPVSAGTLRAAAAMGILCANYLTDDPWNSTLRGKWFFEMLPNYDVIFSVRRANLEALKQLGCPRVVYLPFGYDHGLFYPDNPTEAQRREYESDVLFVGGADKDRLPYIAALIRAGYKVRLYGAYWHKFHETRPYAQGLGNPQTIRLATACAKVALCLVRRANRDDNCMRSFEIPAIGGCMLAEDTQIHRELFGPEAEAVCYFKTPAEMLQQTQILLRDDALRARLAQKSHRLIASGSHTYADRLRTILQDLKS